MKRSKRSLLVVSAAVLMAMMIGNAAGNALSDVVPFLSKTIPIGLESFSIKLYIVDFNIGLLLDINVTGIIGGLVGLLIVSRY